MMFATPIRQHQNSFGNWVPTDHNPGNKPGYPRVRSACSITHPVVADCSLARRTAVRCQSAPVRRCLLIDKTLKDLASGRKTSGGGHFIALVYTRGVGGLTGGRWVRRARVWAVKVKWHVHSANCWRWRWAHRQRWLVDALVIECPLQGAHRRRAYWDR